MSNAQQHLELVANPASGVVTPACKTPRVRHAVKPEIFDWFAGTFPAQTCAKCVEYRNGEKAPAHP